MPDLSGRTVVVTGANSGLGYEATRAFVAAGADVVMACRSVDRGAAAREEIRRAVADADGAASDPGVMSVEACDLADLASVRAFAETVAAEWPSVDVLCNNAGVMAIPRSETADGFETQFGVNHLGHFALTGHLLDSLAAGEGAGTARVVTQSSGLHERGEIDFADLMGEAEYDEWDAYAQSKLANVLFAYELDRRLQRAGLDPSGDRDGAIVSVACHPGYAATNLQYRGPEASGSRLRLLAARAANAVVAQSARRGAFPMLYAATHPSIDGGEYVGPGGFASMRGAPEIQRSSDRSYDRELARRLWARSVELTDVSYGLLADERGRATAADGTDTGGGTDTPS
jgi:NAD(P)-dependent dehydrogenase (short-subunit alcohol dehydrogenase family)